LAPVSTTFFNSDMYKRLIKNNDMKKFYLS